MSAKSMQVKDFSFELPEQLIARFPKTERSSSRLLAMDKQSGELSHHIFKDLADFLQAGDLIAGRLIVGVDRCSLKGKRSLSRRELSGSAKEQN